MTKSGQTRGTGSELTQRGVDLARRVGADRLFQVVVAGESPSRGVETALAMGSSVDWTVDMGGGLLLEQCYDEIGGFHAWRDWPNPFVTFADSIEREGATSALAAHQVSIWSRALAHVAGDECALIISHGGIMECGLAALFTPEEMHGWGGSFWNLEGARVSYSDDGPRIACELLRLDAEAGDPELAAR